jgi:hypothetical protein
MDKAFRSYYSPETLSRAITIYRFPQDYSLEKRVIAYQYLIQYQNKRRDTPLLKHLLDYGVRLYDTLINNGKNELAVELADIYSQYAPPHLRYALLNRNNNEEVKQPIAKATPAVYKDKQNVHNTTINQTVLRASKELISRYGHIFNISVDTIHQNQGTQSHKDMCLWNIQQAFISNHINQAEIIEESFKYIKNAVGTFGIDISLQDVLLCLFMWIQDQPSKNDIELRLLEELKEMKGMCSTGHLARLINVMQGFTDDEKLCIRIHEKEQYKYAVETYLTKELQNCTNEEVLDGMTEETDVFKKFIHTKIKEKLLDWMKEYGDEILDFIPNIVNDFCKAEIFVK